MRKFLLGVLICLFAVNIYAQQTSRLIDNWQYVKGDLGSVWEAFRPVKQSRLPIWTDVTIPHSFNQFDAVDPDVAYYQGPGWYRTYLNINNPYKSGRTVIHFEGSGQKTEVYVHTTKVGSHVGGYDEFSVDITDAISLYKKNNPEAVEIPIAVRCDNTRDVEMIPSDLSDFNVYGGLYRYVNLVYLPPVSLETVLVDYTLDEKYKIAEIDIRSSIKNYLNSDINIELEFILSDATGKILNDLKQDDKVWSSSKKLTSFELKAPHLWHPNDPYLYNLEVAVIAKGVRYTETHKIGFKQVEFIEKGPFQVNGERLLLRGTHRHEDHAGTAAAMTESQIRQEMLLMKEIGINFIRLGHYQQSPIVLDLCDSLGIFVWEEIPWCRGGLGGEVYREQARRMLTNMIHQHHNHASVIIWGLGNENDWPGDFSEFDKDSIRAFMKELNDLSHELDPVRKTAIRRCDFCKDIVDVYSPSIWAGWYRGKYTKYQEVSYKEAMTVDHFLHVEWGASHHAGRHSETPDKGLASITANGADERSGDFLLTGGDPRVSKDGDWSETYACNLIDWHLKEQEKMDWLTGTAYWPFKDFSTPLRPENPVPYVNQKGVLQRDFSKKESFYVFQSYWTEDPMVRIYGHTWETRYGDTDEDKLVKVYSNCSEAELFLNGESMGIRQRNSQDFPAAGLRWKVKFNEGENHIKVIASKDKIILEDELSFTYQVEIWSSPSELKIEEVNREGDVVTVCAKIYDENGVFCPDSKNMVEFEIAGNGKLLDKLGTWDGSNKIQLYNGRAFIKAKLNSGQASLSVKSEGIKAAIINLEH